MRKIIALLFLCLVTVCYSQNCQYWVEFNPDSGWASRRVILNTCGHKNIGPDPIHWTAQVQVDTLPSVGQYIVTSDTYQFLQQDRVFVRHIPSRLDTQPAPGNYTITGKEYVFKDKGNFFRRYIPVTADSGVIDLVFPFQQFYKVQIREDGKTIATRDTLGRWKYSDPSRALELLYRSFQVSDTANDAEHDRFQYIIHKYVQLFGEVLRYCTWDGIITDKKRFIKAVKAYAKYKDYGGKFSDLNKRLRL